MKRTSIFLLGIVLFSCHVFAQMSEPVPPYSFSHSVTSNIQTITMPKVNVDSLLEQDRISGKNVPYHFGYAFDRSYEFHQYGTWTDLPDGGKLWRLRVKSPGAYAISFAYDKFWLPKGATFHIYNQDKSMVIGAFTSKNNKPWGTFATTVVKGEEVTLEYYEPSDASKPGELQISKVNHAYKNPFPLPAGLQKPFSLDPWFGDSGGCNNNANCPTFDSWQEENHSVAAIEMGTDRCSGAMINNANQDYTPYLLTGKHCIDDSHVSPHSWIFHFNYESSSCSNPSSPPNSDQIEGAEIRAYNDQTDFF